MADIAVASFLLIKSSHVHILCKYYFLTSILLGKARAKLLPSLLTFFFIFVFLCFCFVFFFMLDCMCRHPSGVKYTYFWYFMSLLAVLMFASFSPGKTKIYCKVSENSLIFFLCFGFKSKIFNISSCPLSATFVSYFSHWGRQITQAFTSCPLICGIVYCLRLLLQLASFFAVCVSFNLSG